MAEDIFQLRYTVPGLGYFTALSVSVAAFFPNLLQSETHWVALAAIAAVGTVPTGYLINQFILLWQFLKGRYATYDHIIELGEWIFSKEMDERILTLYPDGRQVHVRITDLRDELRKLGDDYIKKNPLLPLLRKDARTNVEKYGLLAPLHDILLEESKTHARYRQTGWLHSNTTCVLLLALGLALLPWGIASCFNNFALAPTIIFEEFWWAAVLGFFVQRLTRFDSDLNERFLTWLFKMRCLG
jgi:hypothetical protein